MQKKKMIPDALRKHKLNGKAQAVFAEYPQLMEITESVAEFMTPHFIGEKHPLFEECIVSAMESIELATKAGNNRYDSFLVGLVSPAWRLLERRIAVEDEDDCEAWVPMQESVAEFIERLGGTLEGKKVVIYDEPAPGYVTHPHAAIMLAVRVMAVTQANKTVNAIMVSNSLNEAVAA